MKKIYWTDELSVNNSELDSHHQKLINLFNELGNSIFEDSSTIDAFELLGSLKDYTIYHFTTEEKLMKEANYPGLTKHIEEHTKFMKSIDKLADQLTNDSDLYELFLFLNKWLVIHIQVEDQKYKEYI